MSTKVTTSLHNILKMSANPEKYWEKMNQGGDWKLEDMFAAIHKDAMAIVEELETKGLINVERSNGD